MTATADVSGNPAPDDPRLAGAIGLRVSSAARTVSAGECGILTSLTWARGPLHTLSLIHI